MNIQIHSAISYKYFLWCVYEFKIWFYSSKRLGFRDASPRGPFVRTTNYRQRLILCPILIYMCIEEFSAMMNVIKQTGIYCIYFEYICKYAQRRPIFMQNTRYYVAVYVFFSPFSVGDCIYTGNIVVSQFGEQYSSDRLMIDQRYRSIAVIYGFFRYRIVVFFVFVIVLCYARWISSNMNVFVCL